MSFMVKKPRDSHNHNRGVLIYLAHYFQQYWQSWMLKGEYNSRIQGLVSGFLALHQELISFPESLKSYPGSPLVA